MENYRQFLKPVLVALLLFTHVYSYSQSPCSLTATQKILTPRVCQNDLGQVEFTATTSGTLPYTFTYLENGLTKTATTVGSNSVAVVGVVTSIPGKIPYQLTGIQDNSGCSTAPLTIPAETLTINPFPQATLAGSGSVCKDSLGPILTFEGITGIPPFYFTFTVNGKDSSIVHSMSTDSLYKLPISTDKSGTFIYSLVSVTDKNCSNNISGQNATVVVNENPQAAFAVNPERTSITAPTVTMDDFSINGTGWMWDFGDSSVSYTNGPNTHSYKDTGTYKIKLIVTNGQCKDSSYQKVRVYLPLYLFVPNAFTPNGDSVNDVFKAKGDGISKFEMLIFDNLGQIAFTSNDIEKGWDGKSGSTNPPSQTFVYVINLRATNDRHDYTYRGVVTLVR